MTQLVTLDTENPATAKAIEALAFDEDPNVVYLAHHYSRDDWHGPGTPYRTLAAALRSFNDGSYNGPWADMAEIVATPWYQGAHPYPLNQPTGQEWWPMHYDGEFINADELGDSHPYIQRATIQP